LSSGVQGYPGQNGEASSQKQKLTESELENLMDQRRAGDSMQEPSDLLDSAVPQAHHANIYSRQQHLKLEKHFKMEMLT
jgi:hypothetical protein